MAQYKKSFLSELDDRLNQNPAYRHEAMQARPYVQVAKELVRIRSEANLTQKQLAEKIGTTSSVISRMESLDYGRVTLSTLQRIAHALDLELDIRFLKKAG